MSGTSVADNNSATPWRMVAVLGITQIFAWGASFYMTTVLAAPIAADTGWPLTLVSAGVSIAMLASGLVAPRMGALIAVHGGRVVLVRGTAAMAVGLCILAVAPNPVVFIAGWIFIGIAMSASLYDAAFSTLARHLGASARRPISAITLFGGFSSTVCWPLCAWLVQTVGWRGACASLAAILMFGAVPLLRFALPPDLPAPPEAPAAAIAAGAPVSRRRERAIFLLLATGMMSSGFLATILLIHLVTLMRARGIELSAAVSLGMLIGPAQVAGRVVELASGSKHHPVWTMMIATVLIAAGIGLLGIGLPLPAAALILYGTGNGLLTIARGALPLALFGPKDYPRMMGRLARPNLIAFGAAPAVGGFLIETLGADATFAIIAVLALMNVAIAAVLVRLTTR